MTDPYVVRCPACLAEPGEHCTNHLRQLESVHWSRHRLARHWHADHERPPRPRRSPSRQLATAVRGGRGRSG
jgi:hypothetical protein